MMNKEIKLTKTWLLLGLLMTVWVMIPSWTKKEPFGSMERHRKKSDTCGTTDEYRRSVLTRPSDIYRKEM